MNEKKPVWGSPELDGDPLRGRVLPQYVPIKPVPVTLTLFTERVADLVEGDFFGWHATTEVFPDGKIGVTLKGAGGQRKYFNIDVVDAT